MEEEVKPQDDDKERCQDDKSKQEALRQPIKVQQAQGDFYKLSACRQHVHHKYVDNYANESKMDH